MKKYILDLETEELRKEIEALGEDAYRADQVIKWVYQKRAAAFAACSDIPAGLRSKLEDTFTLRALTIKSKEVSRLDGTTRYQFVTHDKYTIAAVLLPKKDRTSVCLSTQAGCAVGCGFCTTGKLKFKRNLSRGEILEQIIQVGEDSHRIINGVLLMGMGEPLLNYENVVAALRAIVDFHHLGIGRRHVTVSTVGLIPQIRKLADENLGVRLALSLHAPDDLTRRKFIPEKIPYSVNEILKAGIYYSRKNRSRLTIEYILVAGINDSLQAAQKLVKLIKESANPKDEIRVNIIPCNATDSKWSAPSAGITENFTNYLNKHEIMAIVREAKGADIAAACGQLGV